MAQLQWTDDRSPKDRLRDCRDDIDRVDTALASLLRERVRLALDAARIKIAAGEPLIAPARESAVLGRVRSLAQSPIRADQLERIFRLIIDETRKAEFEWLSDDTQPHEH